jgi:protein-cysteine N-palmitoyltransferase HHAT
MNAYLEILVYSLHLGIFYLYVIPSIGGEVREVCLKSWRCSRQLSHQTIPLLNLSYTIDTADRQWYMIRSSLVLLSLAMILDKCIMWMLDYMTRRSEAFCRYRITLRHLARIVYSIGMLIVLHGYHALIVLASVSIGYWLQASFPTSRASLWIYGISLLFFKESYRLLKYEDYGFLYILFDRRYGGLYEWHYPVNFLALRIISAGSDTATRAEKYKKEDGCDTEQVIHMNILTYLSYTLYAPLYIAGPIISYQSYVKQLAETSTSSDSISTNTSFRAIALYGLRWIGCFLLLEYLLYAYPFFSVVSSGLLPSLSVKQLAVLCYVLLKMMWMKFLLLWRFFRLWSLLDGVDPPENMLRCMSNNYSLAMFWKGWHASFNRWIVQYIYIPLGGDRKKALSVWLIFLFVAMWHDFEWKLVAWGILNSGFFVVEVNN